MSTYEELTCRICAVMKVHHDNFLSLTRTKHEFESVADWRKHIAELREEATERSATRRSEILKEADALINGDRQKDYGTPAENFSRLAEFWNTYLGIDSIRPHDVANMLGLLKVSRMAYNGGTKDTYVDSAGYFAIGGELVQEGL